MRKLTALLVCLTVGIAVTVAAQPGQDRLAGTYQVSFLDNADLLNFWTLKLETKDGKLVGTAKNVDETFPGSFKDVVLKGDTLIANFEFRNQPMVFTVTVPKGDAKQLPGHMNFGGNEYPAQLRTISEEEIKNLKPMGKVDTAGKDFAKLKAEVAKRADELGVFVLASALITEASEAKASAADLKAALEPALKSAKGYGKFHQETVLKFARSMAANEAYAALAEEFAQQALKELGATADASSRLRGLDVLAMSLEKQNKKDALTKIRATIDDLETKGHEENEKAGLGFEPAQFGGRQTKRVVLVELFTGAQCPPCVAADLAFEGLGKTFKSSDVVLLQYHLHIPRPDPMTSPDTEARQNYYGKEVRGTPSIFFNGKSAAGGGGGKAAAGGKYKQYRDIVDPLLKSDDAVTVGGNPQGKDKNDNAGGITFQPFSKIAIGLDAKRTGDNVAITVAPKGYKADANLKLRLAVVEPWVRYPGSNGLSYHAHVVRALAGSPDGIALDKDNIQKTVKVDLKEVHQAADRHLQKVDSFLQGTRVFSYRNLHVVAFVQDDLTKEVLHAVEVAVK